jgi:primosomal protein N' (replication factor Y)
VRVPFGERALTGVVTGAAAEGQDTPSSAPATLREIVEVLDDEPVCPPELLELARRAAGRFFASTGELLKSILPARLPAAGAVRYRITERGALARSRGREAEILAALAGGESVPGKQLPGGASRGEALRSLEERGWIRPVSDYRDRARRRETAYEAAPASSADPASVDARERYLRRSPRAADVLSWLESLGRPATAAEIRLATGSGAAAVKGLAARGLVRSFEQDVAASSTAALPPAPRALEPRRLTDEQHAVTAALASAIRERRYFPALLQGVTGSGKTEVYLRAIAAALDAGRGAIWLVPEIALTPVFARELARELGGPPRCCTRPSPSESAPTPGTASGPATRAR